MVKASGCRIMRLLLWLLKRVRLSFSFLFFAAVGPAAAYGYTVPQVLEQADITIKKQEQGCIMSW